MNSQSRQIKFRAWDTELNKFISPCNQPIVGGAVGDLKWSLEPDGVPIIFMQFTGLLDKDGKEIYEGDIVAHFTKNRVRAVKRAVIKWEISRLGFNLTSKPIVVVIGNIYENPELLP